MTPKQFYLTIIIFTFTLKIQKLPCLIYNQLEKDSIVLILLYFVVDILAMIVFYLFAQKLRDKKSLEGKFSGVVGFFIKIPLILLCIYFFLQSLIFYEAIQDLFSHILFDNLSWTLFSLFLLFAIYYLASLDLKIIGRSFEIYFFIIITSISILTIMGVFQTDFTNILPLQTIKNHNYFEAFKTFNLWFGDYILVFFLGVNTKGTTLKRTLRSYILTMIVILFLYYEFYGIFLEYSSIQPSLVSVISEQTLLGIDIGRPEWFCILIAEIGAVLSASVCFCFSTRIAKHIFPKFKYNYILIFLVLAMYFLDIIYLVDLNAKEIFFLDYIDIFALMLKIIFFAVMIGFSLYFCSKTAKKKVKSEKV